MKRIILLAVTTVFIVQCSKDSQEEKDLYLLIGQSNMAGRAEITEEVSDTLQGVFLFTNDSLNPWEAAANPLNKYSTIRKKIEMQRVGPGYSFARKMQTLNPEPDIGLIVNAKGGTSILKWMPGTHFYDEAVRRTKNAEAYGKLKGILWLQGSSDSRRTETYLDSLIVMVTSLRNDFGNQNLPFIACELSEDRPHKKAFNEMIRGLPGKLEITAVVSSQETSTTDSTHYDTESQLILGERFAELFVELDALVQERK